VSKRFSGALDALGIRLGYIPESLSELKLARNAAMLSAHPDKGGSEEKAKEINRAYKYLKDKFFYKK
jgi:curved DNA-binding protein CbpA